MKKEDIIDLEKANYLMTSASTLITTGSIFVLAFVSSLAFLGPGMGGLLPIITYFMAGTLIVGFLAIISGVEKLFLSFRYATGKRSADIGKTDVIYAVIGLVFALIFITVLGIDEHTETIPFIAGMVIALLIVFLPRHAVLSDKLLEFKMDYVFVGVAALAINIVIGVLVYAFTGIYYISLPLGHIFALLLMAVFMLAVAKLAKKEFTKQDAFSLSLTALLLSLAAMLPTYYAISTLTGSEMSLNYIFKSVMEDALAVVAVFVLFFSVFKTEK